MSSPVRDARKNERSWMMKPDTRWSRQGEFRRCRDRPLADPAHDGANNYEEYVVGTLPKNGASRLELATTEAKPDCTIIRWQSQPYQT